MSRSESASASPYPRVGPIYALPDDYYRSTSYVSDSERCVEGEADVEREAFQAGDHGGRGTRLAGGYPRSQSTHKPAPAPDLDLESAGDDPYAGYDPGMAGCTVEPGTCHIPGVPWMGASPPESPTHRRLRPQIRPTSRGYERDEEEYAESFSSPSATSSATGEGVVEPVLGPAAPPATVEPPAIEPNTSTGSASAPVPVDSKPEPEGPHTPRFGTRLVGHVQRFAGRVLRDPDIQARGQRHMTGHP